MDPNDRTDFEVLKQRHDRLQHELDQLAEQLVALEKKMGERKEIAAAPRLLGVSEPFQIRTSVTSPVGVPPIIQSVPPEPVKTFSPSKSVDQLGTASLPRRLPEQVRTSAPPEDQPLPEEQPRSFEMKLGTYWFVRIGIVLLLTGLVFFANYAYQNLIVHVGPLGKLGLLYMASGLLLGVGTWWQRKEVKLALKNYAQVVFAGGLASVYFTTFAAHYFEPLKVIQSAGLDGILLLGWTAFMIWIADRKKSEVLALFSILLAFYASIITRVGMFTLYSNLLLAGAAIFFLLRNRWAALTVASVVATYAAYVFWRFFSGEGWHWATPEEGLWQGAFFLMSYWALFTAAVFLSRGKKFPPEARASFLTLNNGAFFSLFLLTMLQVHHGGLWRFLLIYGSILLALAWAAAKLLAGQPLTRDAYLTQGLLLVTLGFITKFSGPRLALILATESVVLLKLSARGSRKIYFTGAFLTGLLAAFWGIDGLRTFDGPTLWMGASLGAFLFLDAVIIHGFGATSVGERLRAGPAFFALLSAAVWSFTTFHNTAPEKFPAIIMSEGLLLTMSVYLFELAEVALAAQGMIIAGLIAWGANAFPPGSSTISDSYTSITGVITLVSAHWWHRQQKVKLAAVLRKGFERLYSLGVVGLIYFWFSPKFELRDWTGMTGTFAVLLTAYSVVTRLFYLGAFAQLFVAAAVAMFAWQLFREPPGGPIMLAPIFSIAALVTGTEYWFHRNRGGNATLLRNLHLVSSVYRAVAVCMSIAWILNYVSAEQQILILSGIALGLFVVGGVASNPETLVYSGVFSGVALWLFLLRLMESETIAWANFITLLFILLEQRIARRWPARFKVSSRVHALLILAGGISVWLFLARWISLANQNSFLLTATWSGFALALILCGILFRERAYRWLGLAVLACSLGRIIIFDVWKLETGYRIASFMALGVVLLLLGFVYNKYQEKIREWL
jgi:uncharacterized membrane protein